MAEKPQQKGENGLKPGTPDGQAAVPFLPEKAAVDPGLAILFASSVSYIALLAFRTHLGTSGLAKIYEGRSC
jgi:hypothetical protein